MMVVFLFCVYIREEARQRENLCYQRQRWLCWVRINAKQKQEKKEKKMKFLSEPGFDPGTCGLWAHHASAAPL